MINICKTLPKLNCTSRQYICIIIYERKSQSNSYLITSKIGRKTHSLLATRSHLVIIIILFFSPYRFLCRRFLGDGWIDLLQIFRIDALPFEVCTAVSIFEKSLPVGSYPPFIDFQMTILSRQKLKNDKS